MKFTKNHKRLTLCLGEFEKLDRFIPHRANLNNSHSYFLLKQTEKKVDNAEETSILYQKIDELNSEAYRNMLNQTFKINDSFVIPIFPSTNKDKKATEKLWPAFPRSKPCIRSSIAILDLPHLNEHFYFNLIDWSVSDYITASLHRTVYLYYPSTHATRKINLISCGTSVKWNRDGNRLAIGMRHGYLQLWDRHKDKIIYETVSVCLIKSCSVSAIEWHPTKEFLVAGCTNGSIKVYSHDLIQRQKLLNVHTKQIVSLAFNCDGRYLASSSMDGYFLVFLWDDVATRCCLMKISLGSPIRAMAWHPWKSALLCVGSLTGGLNLWDVSALKLMGKSNPVTKNGDHHFLFNLTFNKVSGELVTSHLIQNIENIDDEWGQTQINVLSSFDKVVDRMMGHIGSVLYLKWNPNGTQLATAGVDETLQLWNFLPKQEQKHSRKSFGGVTEFSRTLNHNSFLIR